MVRFLKIIFIFSDLSKIHFIIMERKVVVVKESRSIFKIGISSLVVSETHFQ